jgi:hypothetical protein
LSESTFLNPYQAFIVSIFIDIGFLSSFLLWVQSDYLFLDPKIQPNIFRNDVINGNHIIEVYD